VDANMSTQKKTWKYLLVVSIAMFGATAQATMVLPQNLEQLESRAGLVFVGRCTSHTTELGARGLAVNVFTFEVIEPVKGPARKGAHIEVRQFGSGAPNASGLIAHIPGLPSYRVGQEVLLFLNPPSRIGLTSPVGLWQGLFRVVRDRAGKRQIIVGPSRREMLLRGVDATKYAADERLTDAEKRLLTRLPGRVDVTTFCSLVRKIARERAKAKTEARL
jgi:hypothetical protein